MVKFQTLASVTQQFLVIKKSDYIYCRKESFFFTFQRCIIRFKIVSKVAKL